eukprot:TRINITY_DN4860_c2_g2_i2.p1 TRINITY_DN4860_c2_g2~~TRINITY_DN4860_c2_g2_i2.p1  ORF type:complete len:126 (-),score=31.65 TRINITY_DN4860_c2_g2_i2:24-401(-)
MRQHLLQLLMCRLMCRRLWCFLTLILLLLLLMHLRCVCVDPPTQLSAEIEARLEAENNFQLASQWEEETLFSKSSSNRGSCCPHMAAVCVYVCVVCVCCVCVVCCVGAVCLVLCGGAVSVVGPFR